MNRVFRLAAATVVTLLVALPIASSAFAAEASVADRSAPAVLHQEGHGESTDSGSTGDVKTRVTWMIVGIVGASVAMGLLYLFKRRIGGFPKNPSWVAPITIMPSSELPGDVDSHAAESHGHQPAAGHH